MVGGHIVAGAVLLIGVLTISVGMASSKPPLKVNSNRFAADLFSALRKNKANENLVVSPISLEIALLMVYAGAGGNTLLQIAKALHVEGNDPALVLESIKSTITQLQDPVLEIASTVFADQSLKLVEAYEKKITGNFGANIERVDFNDTDVAANTINTWCDKSTHGKIKELFKADDLRDAISVIANAVYFKANWKYQFDPQLTKERDFTGANGITKVKMMNVKKTFLYSYSTKLQAQILELPYNNDKFRMLILLPIENGDGTFVSLTQVENNLKNTLLEDVLESMSPEEVNVFLPKFKIEMSIDLNDALKQLGVTDLFTPSANLSGITEGPINVSKVKQKVFMEVNEEGTEAAAVTGVMMTRALIICEEFVADRPFAFILSSVEQPGSTLFVGEVWDPTVSSTERDEL